MSKIDTHMKKDQKATMAKENQDVTPPTSSDALPTQPATTKREKFYTYKMRYYVNASHAMRWSDGEGKQHNHTWEIICEIHSKGDHMIVFVDIEKKMKEIFDSFSGKFLNTLPYFKTINPTVENVTTWLFNLLSPVLEELNAELVRLEVGESPTRSYCISTI